jgi:hypothetical protein
VYNKLQWFIQHGLSASTPSIGIDIGLTSSISQQVQQMINKQEHGNVSYDRLRCLSNALF